MTNDKPSITDEPQNQTETSHPTDSDAHPIATGLGIAGVGVAGAALGRSVAAIAGGMAGNTHSRKRDPAGIASVAQEAISEIQSVVGLDTNDKPIELPLHYTWEELQALSKPQGNTD